MKKICSVALFLITSLHASSDNWDAQKYAQESTPQFEFAFKTLEDYSFNGDEQVIEFGCGNGRLAHILLERLPRGHIHGVDNSQDQIRLAKNIHADNVQLSFECADIASYNTTKKYDVALSFSTLHWVGNDQAYAQALKQIAQSLKPGGRAVLSHLAGKGDPILENIKNILNTSPWNRYGTVSQIPIFYPNPSVIEQMARDAGFEIVYFKLVTGKLHFNTLEEAIHHIIACPLVPFIPKELQYDFYAEVHQDAIKSNHMIVLEDDTITNFGEVAVLKLRKK